MSVTSAGDGSADRVSSLPCARRTLQHPSTTRAWARHAHAPRRQACTPLRSQLPSIVRDSPAFPEQDAERVRGAVRTTPGICVFPASRLARETVALQVFYAGDRTRTCDLRDYDRVVMRLVGLVGPNLVSAGNPTTR